jgi:hypothetical protein
VDLLAGAVRKGGRMNPELQAQSDAITGAIRHLELAIQFDLKVATGIIAGMIFALILVIWIRR